MLYLAAKSNVRDVKWYSWRITYAAWLEKEFRKIKQVCLKHSVEEFASMKSLRLKNLDR